MKASTYEALYEHEKAHWWYRVRRKLVARLVANVTKEIDRPFLLDVGCGTGGLLQELASKCNAAGVDMSSQAVQYCKERGLKDVVLGDVTKLPIKSNTQDVVLALDVLEHVEHDVQGATELHRVLRSGGTAIVFVPALQVLWGSTDEVSHHKRRYTRKMLLEVLEKSGFTVERISYFNTFLFLPILFFRLLARYTGIELFDEYRPGVGRLNGLLYRIFLAEINLLKYIHYPVGVSIMAVCKKVN